jgi:hypothetical protein
MVREYGEITVWRQKQVCRWNSGSVWRQAILLFQVKSSFSNCPLDGRPDAKKESRIQRGILWLDIERHSLERQESYEIFPSNTSSAIYLNKITNKIHKQYACGDFENYETIQR